MFVKRLVIIAVLAAVLFTPVFADGQNEKKEVSTAPENVVEVVDITPIQGEIVSSVPANTMAVVNLTGPTPISRQAVTEVVSAYAAQGSELTENDALQILIRQELLNQAFARENYQVTNDLASYFIYYYFYSTYGIEVKDDATLEAVLQQVDIDLNQVISSLAADYFLELYLETYYSDIMSGYAQPTEEDIISLYDTSAEFFTSSEKIRIGHVFFFFDEEHTKEDLYSLASEVRNAIAAGEITFEEAVVEFSADANTKDNGGILGWVNMPESEFELSAGYLLEDADLLSSERHKTQVLGENTYNALFALKTGEISEVLETPQGYHIFKVFAHNPEKQLALTDSVYPGKTATVADYLNYYISYYNAQNAYYEAIEKMFNDLASESGAVTYYN